MTSQKEIGSFFAKMWLTRTMKTVHKDAERACAKFIVEVDLFPKEGQPEVASPAVALLLPTKKAPSSELMAGMLNVISVA